MARVVQRMRPGGPEAVPVLVHSAGSGPVVAICANIHGDEATGVGVVHALDTWLVANLRRGTVVLYPSLNPGGLYSQTRTLPEGRDLNRLFPGRLTGTLSERHVSIIWSDLMQRKLSLLIDLHADSARSIPYAIVDRALPNGRGVSLEPVLTHYARASGLTVLHEYPVAEYQRYSLERSLAGAMVNRRAIPAITLEVGPRRWLCPRAVDAAVDATYGVLAAAGLVERERVVHPTRVAGGPWCRAASPRARASGLFREVCAPGVEFVGGDLLGTIVDLEGRVLDRINAPRAGLVISWSEAAWLTVGSVAGTLGLIE